MFICFDFHIFTIKRAFRAFVLSFFLLFPLLFRSPSYFSSFLFFCFYPFSPIFTLKPFLISLFFRFFFLIFSFPYFFSLRHLHLYILQVSSSHHKIVHILSFFFSLSSFLTFFLPSFYPFNHFCLPPVYLLLPLCLFFTPLHSDIYQHQHCIFKQFLFFLPSFYLFYLTGTYIFTPSYLQSSNQHLFSPSCTLVYISKVTCIHSWEKKKREWGTFLWSKLTQTNSSSTETYFLV